MKKGNSVSPLLFYVPFALYMLLYAISVFFQLRDGAGIMVLILFLKIIIFFNILFIVFIWIMFENIFPKGTVSKGWLGAIIGCFFLGMFAFQGNIQSELMIFYKWGIAFEWIRGMSYLICLLIKISVFVLLAFVLYRFYKLDKNVYGKLFYLAVCMCLIYPIWYVWLYLFAPGEDLMGEGYLEMRTCLLLAQVLFMAMINKLHNSLMALKEES